MGSDFYTILTAPVSATQRDLKARRLLTPIFGTVSDRSPDTDWHWMRGYRAWHCLIVVPIGTETACHGADSEAYWTLSLGRTGKWPGEADCERLGYFVNDNRDFPDLDRLSRECDWNRERQRWEDRPTGCGRRDGALTSAPRPNSVRRHDTGIPVTTAGLRHAPQCGG
jgi:hypothetical protein